jgi:hypothetical protein
MKKLLVTAAAVVTAVALASIPTGCVGERLAGSLVQPNAIPKAILAGTWYYKVTVLDHPYEAKFTFVGEEAFGLEKVRWVVDEKFFYAFRAYETVVGTGGGAQLQTSPVAAYRIASHFDIRHAGGAAGEEAGELVEDSWSRPWPEREYMRVDWSQNLVTDRFHFMKEYADPVFANLRREPVSYHDQQSLVVTADYIEVVSSEVVSPSPESVALDPSYPVGTDSMMVTFKHSFLKVIPNDYRPMEYTDKMFERFAFFRLDREGYDKNWGLSDLARDFKINRFNVFARWTDDAGVLIPVKDREIRRIVFYLGKDFPPNLRETAYAVVHDWDIAFRHAVAGMLEADGEPRESARIWVEAKMDAAANNGWGALVLRLRDHDECDDSWQSGVVDADGARVFRDAERCAKNMGDLRYNFIQWIPKPMAAAPLEYAPFSADPETGETVNANVNIYGAALESQKALAMEFYDIVAYPGEVNAYVEVYLNSRYAGVESATLPEGPAKPAENAKAAIESILKMAGSANPAGGLDGRSALQDRALMTAAHKRGAVFAAEHPEIESLLLPADLMVTRGFDVSSWNAAALSPAQLERFSPLRGGRIGADNPRKAEFLKSRFRCFFELNEFSDSAVWRLVQTYTLEKGFSREQVANVVEKTLFRGAAAHALGHTLGLRHMFEGSADFTNYFDRYWEIYKTVTEAPPEMLATPACAGVETLADFNIFETPASFPNNDSFELYQNKWRCLRSLLKKEGADFYQYSSIMDYPAEFFAAGFPGVETGDPAEAPKTDLFGEIYPPSVGKYDIAAIKFGYGGVAERWDAGNTLFDMSKRQNAKYYAGGEDCLSKACPYAAAGQTCMTGVCGAVYIQGSQIWDGGQRCREKTDCPGY